MIELIVRDITCDEDIVLELPKKDIEELGINKNHEYIIIENSLDIHLSEFTSIIEINELFNFCEENGISEEVIQVLFEVFFYEEAREKILEDNYVIVDFDTVTSNWSCGNIYSDNDKGLVLFLEGYAELPFQYKEEYESYINWSYLWESAATGENWRVVRVNGTNFLVC